MKKWLFAVLLGSILALGACGGGGDTEDNADTGDEGGTTEAAAGEEIYKQNCSSCHGSDLSGGAGPSLENVGSNYSADDIAEIIDNGIGTMPAQNLDEADRDELAGWLAEKK